MTYRKQDAVLALADGRVFKGHSFGAERKVENAAIGEVVFNTSQSGYQEIVTDPSYSEQIMCFTSVYIGNVGANSEDIESSKIHTAGVVCRNISKIPSNFRSELSFSDFLRAQNIMGISGIDTRDLVQHLRDNGSQMGALACGTNVNSDDLVDQAKASGSMLGKNLVDVVSCKTAYDWTEGTWKLGSGYSKPDLSKSPLCVVVDCGVKNNILRLLVNAGFKVKVVPAYTDAKEISSYNPAALFLSNGPGDPATLQNIVEMTKFFIGKIPIFGICLGHQIIGQALGGTTYKFKFGHRGGNHPVKDLTTNKVEITVQNHGFAIEQGSLPDNVTVSHVNLNDGTVEGLEVLDKKLFCIQYHPESSPGPHDARYLFERFYNLLG